VDKVRLILDAELKRVLDSFNDKFGIEINKLM